MHTLDETWLSEAQVRGNQMSARAFHYCLEAPVSCFLSTFLNAPQGRSGIAQTITGTREKSLATEHRGLISRCSLPKSKKVLIDPRLFPWDQENFEHFLVNTLECSVLNKSSGLQLL